MDGMDLMDRMDAGKTISTQAGTRGTKRDVKTIFLLLIVCAILTGCAGQNFRYSDARRIKPGMTTQEVVTIMGSKPNVTEVHGLETHFVWAYGDLFANVKQVRVPFDAQGHVTTAPVVP